MLQTKRLFLRRWEESDAEDLYTYASDPRVGPAAGWPPHQSIAESCTVIREILSVTECYAVVLAATGQVIGAIQLMFKHGTECELGYWLGVPFWGQGLIPEAAREVLRHAFDDLGMDRVWCCCYTGNEKSRRVQEKLGFRPHHLVTGRPVLGEIRDEQVNLLTRDTWKGEAT